MNRALPVFLPHSSAAITFSISRSSSSWSAPHGEAPQVDIVQAGLLQPVVQALLELVDGTGDVRSARQRPIEAHVDFFAPALHGLGVDRHLARTAGIDVVDAVVEAGVDHVPPVLLEVLAAGLVRDALPVPADADHGDHEAGAAQPAVIHVFVVAAGLASGRRATCLAASAAPANIMAPVPMSVRLPMDV